MFGYIAIYKGKQIEVYALNQLAARDKAADIFKARKRYDVQVFLCETPTGETVTQVTP